MKSEVLKHLYRIAKESQKPKLILPSIRGLAIRFKISNNDVMKVFNFYKEQGIITTEQGSKSYLDRRRFLNSFKNDTLTFFGENVKRKVIARKIVKTASGYEYKFIREFWKGNKIVSLSIDSLFSWTKMRKINIKRGLDHFISKLSKNKKIVTKETTIINIENFEEFKKLKEKYCVILETKIFDDRQTIISHSFSVFPIRYYKNYHIEMLI